MDRRVPSRDAMEIATLAQMVSPSQQKVVLALLRALKETAAG